LKIQPCWPAIRFPAGHCKARGVAQPVQTAPPACDRNHHCCHDGEIRVWPEHITVREEEGWWETPIFTPYDEIYGKKMKAT